MTTDPRARAFEALAHLLVSESSLADGLGAMLRVVTEAIPTASHAGLTMGDGHGGAATPVCTHAEVPDIDRAQYESGRGPCLDAWRRSEVVRLDDLTDPDGPYPEFRAAARAHGLSSTISVPLLTGGGSFGALNLYRAAPGGFSTEDEQLLRDLTPATAAFVSNAQAYWQAFELSEQLSQALTSRSVIDQAKGMLMALDPSLDADGAFQLLREASRRENVKLRDIALRITERRLPADGH